MLMGAHAAPVVRPPPPPPPFRLNINYDGHRHPHCYLLFLFVVLLLSSSSCVAELSDRLEHVLDVAIHYEPERQALLKFKSSLGRNADSVLPDWNANTATSFPCSIVSRTDEPWTGVLCYKGRVWGLQLERMNLSGEINVDSLLPLSHLRTLSFMNNEFEGPLPEFRKLGALKSLFLSFNRFSGDIPDDAFNGMSSLKKLYMSNNMFTGNIPTSLAYSPRLFELRLEHNQFVGPIPDFPPGILKHLNVSYNQLQGLIPPSLKHLDLTSFSGNKALCGPPLGPVCSDGSSSSPSTPEPAANIPSPPPAKKLSITTIIIYVLCGLIFLAAIAVLFMVYQGSKDRDVVGGPTTTTTTTPAAAAPYYKDDKWSSGAVSVQQQPNSDANAPAVAELPSGHSRNKSSTSSASTCSSSSPSPPGAGDQHGKLSFVRDDRLRFDLQDLLRASAEVLGSGSFGSSYKAVLMDGQAVVVKRFKQMNNCGKEDFHEHMRRLGRLSHPNLLPLVAYYYRKEEKLLVFDFVHNGSLARHLHGNKVGPAGGRLLDWPTRLKIIKGVARGLAYLYNELPSLNVPHGHLKSSNVLLNESMEPKLMDYTLVPVVNLEQAQHFMVAYKSPEYTKNGRTSKKTDVWSLGILILETLTGKFPANYLAQGPGYGKDLANWVSSIVDRADDDGDEVFDKEIVGSTKNAQGQMQKLLKIGADCCKVDVETRLDFEDAADRIEMVKERDDDH